LVGLSLILLNGFVWQKILLRRQSYRLSSLARLVFQRTFNRRLIQHLSPARPLYHNPKHEARGGGRNRTRKLYRSEPNTLFFQGLLREELNGLRFDIAHEIMREVHEERYHNGQSAVVQVLAYK
jgi:hypothetical protein